MARTIFIGKVARSGRARKLALGAAAATSLALCLIALQPAEAAFPGNNGRIVFQSNRDASAEIYSISPAGGEATRMTFRNGGHAEPAWSPDGTRIAFNSGNDIHVMKAAGMNPDGTGSRALTTTSGAESEPAWSPDGTRIAFVSNTLALDGQTDPEIWVMNADGSGRRPLTNNSYPEFDPAWSPDGSKIAFESSRRDLGDTDQNIYVMNADGSGQTNITPNVSDPNNIYQGNDNDPVWSPDGSKIAYVHAGETGLAGGAPDIWTRDPNGANRVPLSGTNGVSETMPAWSPDGSKIAYVRATGTDRNIAVMNANGSNQHAIDTDTANDINPDWQPVPLSLRIGDARVQEKTTNARFAVRLSAASQQTVAVDYATADGSAKSPADYATKSGTLIFSPGETSKTVSVAIRGDRRNERNEVFFVNLSNASTTVADASGKGTIVDND